MSTPDRLQNAEQLLSQLEVARAKRELTEEPDAALELLDEIERAKHELDA